MSYIGKAPGFGIRNRYYYTATASQTLFDGADDNGQTLAYADSKYLDVYLNGVLLVAGTDYTATTLTSVTLTSGASASDIIEIVAYDIFSVADTVSAANGGTFNGAVTVDSTLTASGLVTAQDGLVVDNDGATVATFDRATSDGAVLDIQKNGSTIGSIATSDGDLTLFSTAAGHGGIRFSQDRIFPIDNSGALIDNDISLGGAGNRFQDLYLSGGVYLGGTGAANYLDDYEEGTFSPTLSGTTGGPSGVNFTARYGRYIKVGNVVHVDIHLNISSWSSGPSGNVIIDNIPFATASNSNYRGAGSISFASGFGGDQCPSFVLIVENVTRLDLLQYDTSDPRDNKATSISTAGVSGNEAIVLSATYIVD